MISEVRIAPLDLDLVLGCGQTFRWARREDGSWVGVLGDQAVRLEQKGSRLIIEARPDRQDTVARIEKFLRAGDDIRSIQRALAKDAVLAPGLRGLRGLRLVKMDEWECLVSYVLATYANIPRISRMIETLARRFGDEILPGVHAFPRREQLLRAGRLELAMCGLGYRGRYLHELCEMLDEGRISELARMGYEDLRRELKELPGVGDKVADCVSLFGFGKLEAFPIDIWVERALKRLYGQHGSYSRLRAFATKRFGLYAGYAQEYLYYNERVNASRGACAFTRAMGRLSERPPDGRTQSYP